MKHFEQIPGLPMKPTACLSLAVILSAIACAPTPAEPKPEDTEVWQPEPVVVVPGATGADAPSDAAVLFDGTNLDEWVGPDNKPAGWMVAGGVMTVVKTAGNITTRRSFDNYQLHLEWRIPPNITGDNQARGNSGLFMATVPGGGYELQILDSYLHKTYVNGQAASLYKQTPPLANAMRRPGDWQVYDVIWMRPTFHADGSVNSRARVTVFHNGVLVQNNVTLQGTTEYIGAPRITAHGATPLMLQAHDDPSEPISYRNIWLRELR